MRKNEKGTWVCSEDGCGKVYSYYEGLRRHVKKVHNAEPSSLRCDVCGRKYDSKEELQLHQARHDGRRVYKCDYPDCEKAFGYKSQLETHKRKHRHACREKGCDAVFPTYPELRKHAAEFHKEDFACDECGKVFNNKANLDGHMFVHNKSREPHPCPEPGCGRKYLHAKNLAQHLRSAHQNKTVHTCEACGKSLSTKQKLQLHQQTFHSPDNPKPLPKTGARARRRAKAGARDLVNVLSGLGASSSSSDMATAEAVERVVAASSSSPARSPRLDSPNLRASVIAASLARAPKTDVATSNCAVRVTAENGSPVMRSLRRRPEAKKEVNRESGDGLALLAWQGVFREK